MRARLAGSCASKSAHGGDKAALDDASTGWSPLVRTAANKSERILLSVFGREPGGDRIDGGEPPCDRCQIERQAGRILAKQRRHAGDRRAQVAPAGGRKQSVVRYRAVDIGERRVPCCWDWRCMFLSRCPFGSLAGGQQRSREDRGVTGAVIRECYHSIDGTSA